MLLYANAVAMANVFLIAEKVAFNGIGIGLK